MSCSNTSYGNSLGKAPLISGGGGEGGRGGGFLYGKMVRVVVLSFTGCFFASGLKPIMVPFRVLNFHDLIER